MKLPLVTQWSQFGNQPVLLRADLNVPMKAETILDTSRLKATQPTIDYLLDHGARIVLLTHLGRPKAPEDVLSTKRLLPWFTQHGYQIEFAETLEAAQALLAQKKPNSIILLENLRFFAGESPPDDQFAGQLAQLGSYYVNDAFGALHRTDSSIARVPHLFPPANRACGLLVAKELQILDQLLKHPTHPFVLIIGGAKIKDKATLILALLDVVDTIILCPAIVFTFMKALGKPTGASLVDKSALSLCKTVLELAQEKHVQVIVPSDFQVQSTREGKKVLYHTDTIPDGAVGISVGPKTIAHIEPIIQNAHTILFNGAIGFQDDPETMQGMTEILHLMNRAQATTLVAGGDSNAWLNTLRLPHINHAITGGGAVLAYLAKQSLPGLEALTEKRN